MRSYRQLLLANQAWSRELVEEHPDFFAEQVQGQQPEFLWIGCSDSRVSPEQMTNTPPGGMFLHRNIANLVHDDDLNLLSVLQYALLVLKVKHVIVCGHYGCGGIKAALDGGTEGPVHTWLDNARQVVADHRAEIDGTPAGEARLNRLVEVNVRDQLARLAKLPMVRDAFAAGTLLKLHGWVYDLRDGLIKPLLDLGPNDDAAALGLPERVLT